MRLNNQQNFLATLTLTLAMCLRVVPFPHFISSANPDWVLLTLIYWTLMLPYRKGVFNAWCCGLLTDVLLGRTLGEYALCYALVGYVSVTFHKRLRFMPLTQQSVFVFVCLLVTQILVFIIENAQSTTESSIGFWLPVITGTLLWPIIHPFLHFIRSLGHPH